MKRLAISETEQARINFESEVTLISRVHHRNLLRLLGCCRKGPELLLVYEYMEKGSLHSYLFGKYVFLLIIIKSSSAMCNVIVMIKVENGGL